MTFFLQCHLLTTVRFADFNKNKPSPERALRTRKEYETSLPLEKGGNTCFGALPGIGKG